MIFEQFCTLEKVTHRAIKAAKVFAKDEDVRWLNELECVVAELRHAAMTLCEPNTPAQDREAASMRLHRLFTYV